VQTCAMLRRRLLGPTSTLALAMALLPGVTPAHAFTGPVHVLSIKQLLASCGNLQCTDCPGQVGGLRLYSRANQNTGGDCIRFIGQEVIPLADVNYSDGTIVYFSFASWSTIGSAASGYFQKNVSCNPGSCTTIHYASNSSGNLPGDYVNNTIVAAIQT